jgi:hypothetical protein
MHASLMMNAERQLVVADTGSTNGTFVDDERISYGKAVTFLADQKLKLGTVKLAFEVIEKPVMSEAEVAPTEAFKVGEFEFTSKIDKTDLTEQIVPAETVASIQVPEIAVLKAASIESPKATEPSIDINLKDDEKAVSK